MAKIPKLIWCQKERRLGITRAQGIDRRDASTSTKRRHDSEIFVAIKANRDSNRAKHFNGNSIFQSTSNSLTGLNLSILFETLALLPRAKNNASRERKKNHISDRANRILTSMNRLIQGHVLG